MVAGAALGQPPDPREALQAIKWGAAIFLLVPLVLLLLRGRR